MANNWKSIRAVYNKKRTQITVLIGGKPTSERTQFEGFVRNPKTGAIESIERPTWEKKVHNG